MGPSLASVIPASPGASRPAPSRGAPAPLGATPSPAGVNFSVFSRHATQVELLLYDRVDAAEPSRVIRLDPVENRTDHYWHAFVAGLRPGQLYGYRVDGPFDPGRGFRFDRGKLLLDPYGRAVVVPGGYRRATAAAPGDDAATAMRSVVVDPDAYDWEGDAPLRRPASRTIVYEMHVRGFTRHPSSGLPDAIRGTYAGLIAKIPYLRGLGVTAVELMPVFQFDAQDAPNGCNYWGYAPISFFAPHAAYAARRDPLGAVDEFRDMVKALHRAGLEVILDVVFNHTAEGDHDGPTLCFRGFSNGTYYLLASDRTRYADYTGCGNTLNANNAVVRRMILDSLRYWVGTMHVDGFRFDLASVLARDESGHPVASPPVVWDIDSDPVLAGTKLFAEAWDAAGLYQVGSFVGDRWREWNGRFRDDARDFFRGARGSARRFADRLVGSPEVYGHEEREPEQAVNFVTCHDGFTLNDLVSYDRKHNEANGEHGRDGSDDNRSSNCGVEGATDDPAIERLRTRQVKNFMTITLLSFGLPMLAMGDEVRRTQRGNNNAYCQDDDTTWFDWTLVVKHADVRRFVELLCARRLLRSVEHEHLRETLSEMIHGASKAWHGVELDRPDWGDDSHTIAFAIDIRRQAMSVYVALNAYREPLDFALPGVSDGRGPGWRRWIDTALAPPDEIVPWQEAPIVVGDRYRVEARSVVVMFATAWGP